MLGVRTAFICWLILSAGNFQGKKWNLTVKPIICAPLRKNFLENWGHYLNAEARVLLSSVVSTMTPQF